MELNKNGLIIHNILKELDGPIRNYSGFCYKKGIKMNIKCCNSLMELEQNAEN